MNPLSCIHTQPLSAHGTDADVHPHHNRPNNQFGPTPLSNSTSHQVRLFPCCLTFLSSWFNVIGSSFWLFQPDFEPLNDHIAPHSYFCTNLLKLPICALAHHTFLLCAPANPQSTYNHVSCFFSFFCAHSLNIIFHICSGCCTAITVTRPDQSRDSYLGKISFSASARSSTPT